MPVVQYCTVWSRCTDWRVRGMPTATLQHFSDQHIILTPGAVSNRQAAREIRTKGAPHLRVAVAQKSTLKLVLHHSRLTSLHDLLFTNSNELARLRQLRHVVPPRLEEEPNRNTIKVGYALHIKLSMSYTRELNQEKEVLP